MSAEAPIAEGVLEYLIRSIVEEPDEVRIQTSGDERCTFSVTVADGDMGRVIGRRGRVANAIRTIVRAAAIRDETEIDVDFVDRPSCGRSTEPRRTGPPGGRPDRQAPRAPWGGRGQPDHTATGTPRCRLRPPDRPRSGDRSVQQAAPAPFPGPI